MSPETRTPNHPPRRPALRRTALLGAVLACAGVGGCFGTDTKTFPPGLAPFEPVNMAPLPTAQPGNPFPETITFVRLTYTDPTTMNSINSSHARAYIQEPLATVWPAARDPQTGRDADSSNGFSIVAWDTEPAYQYSYVTNVVVNSIVTINWDVGWRHGVMTGPLDAPTATATRWQKTTGSTVISVLEGSLVLLAVPNQPSVTEVDYQYHLDALSSDYSTMEGFLTVIYGRLRDRAHGVPLNPDDCTGCPAPPAGYP